ncbi:MAG: LysR family transcriptional regulator [Lacrimispora sp.]|uniref:LysR family transcriptional regulator n=1 Tax=Lacrimispora sp. TaxID=2719234 RepID=UPI0039E647BB
MDLLQLQYFQVVARLGNVTQAAKELHVSQPSISKTIARLEESLGVPLFERSGRRIHLNQFGETFLRRVERCFNELKDGQRELAELSELERKTVTVGAATSRLLPDLFKNYLADNPDVKFKIRHITKHQEIQKQLLMGEIDLSIFFLPATHPEIHCEPLLVEEIFLAVPPSHPLAGRKSIDLKEVAHEHFIGVTTDSEFWEITNRFCQEAGFTPNIAFEIESLDIIINLVNAGLGIAFLPAYWPRGNPMEPPVQLHIKSPSCQRTIWLSWLKERYATETIRDFREFIIDHFSSSDV